MEKKNYVAPNFEVFEYELNHSVSECVNPTTVKCLIGGQYETIFATGTTGCDTSASTYVFGTYDGVNYFLWYDKTETNSGGNGSDYMAIIVSILSGTLYNESGDYGYVLEYLSGPNGGATAAYQGWHIASYTTVSTDYTFS